MGSVDGSMGKYAVRRHRNNGKSSSDCPWVARVTARARILLKSDDGWAAPSSEALDAALSTVYRVERFAEEGLEGVLQESPGQPAPEVGPCLGLQPAAGRA